jgi:hypothetical protein
MLSSKHNKLIISNSYFHVSAFGHFQAWKVQNLKLVDMREKYCTVCDILQMLVVITLYYCIFFIPHHLFEVLLKFHIISKIIKVLARLYSVRLVWVHTYYGVFIYVYVCVCPFSGNCQAPYVGLWFILFGIHFLLGCLCFHTYYTLCLVLSIFLYNIGLYYAWFPVSCCSLCTRQRHNKHIQHDGKPLYMQYGYRAYDHVLNSTSVHIKEFTVLGVNWFTNLCNCMVLLCWYWQVLYSQPWGKFDESMKRYVSYILRYVYLPAEVSPKVRFYKMYAAYFNYVCLLNMYVISWSCEEPMKCKSCLLSFLYLHQLPNKAFRLIRPQNYLCSRTCDLNRRYILVVCIYIPQT